MRGVTGARGCEKKGSYEKKQGRVCRPLAQARARGIISVGRALNCSFGRVNPCALSYMCDWTRGDIRSAEVVFQNIAFLYWFNLHEEYCE
jgi:hypothetical protein